MKTAHLHRLIASLDNGAWGDEPDGDGTDIRCVRAADFDFTKLRARVDTAPLRKITPTQRRRLSLNRGDLILEKSGGGEKQVVGRAVLYDRDVPAVCSNFAARLRPTPSSDPKYLAYLLSALYFDGATARCVLQTTGIQNLDTDAWLQTVVPVLELDEQRRIADFLDDQVARIDNIIAARSQQLLLVIAARESAAFDSVTGATREDRRPSGLSWVKTLPSDWGSTRLTHVARMGTGHTPSRSVGGYWIDCTIPWLTTTDVHRFRHDEIDRIDDTELHISKLGLANSSAVLHLPGTVALSRTASAGFSIIMGNGMATSQDYATWTCGPKINNVYLLWCLRAMRKDVMGRLATGSTHKTIYFPDLMSIRAPLPPVADQLLAVTAIGEMVDAERQRSAAITRSIELFQELKRSLITSAVTGDFDVSTADGAQVAR